MKHNWKLSCNCVRVCLYNECRWDIIISRMCEIHLVGDVNINKNNASSGGDASSSSASTPPPKTHNHPPTHILHTPQIWSSNAMQSHNHNHMNRLMYDSKTHGTVPPSTSITHGADLVPDVKRVNGNKGLLLTLLFWILHCSVLPLRRSSLSWCRGWVGHQSRCMRPKHFQPPTAVNKSKSCGSVS